MIGLISDLHFGIRNSNQFFLQKQKEFYINQFFPYLLQNNIKTVIDLGDTFDNRQAINISIINEVKDWFFPFFEKNGIDFYMIIGNHDSYYKNTIKINSPNSLLNEFSCLTFIENPVTIDKMDLIPWITESNYEECLNFIQKSDSEICMGHFEINGFDMYKGWTANTDDGLNRKLFKKYKKVFSGHFHQPSEKGNIRYIGSPYQMNWNDYGCKRGFHILNPETLDVSFIENTNTIYEKIYFDPSINQNKFNYSKLKDKIVELYIESKKNLDEFLIFEEKIRNSGLHDYSVIDNTSLKYEENDFNPEDIKTENIVSLYKSYIGDDKELIGLFKEIYQEAQEIK